jgi:hypothetical protein
MLFVAFLTVSSNTQSWGFVTSSIMQGLSSPVYHEISGILI